MTTIMNMKFFIDKNKKNLVLKKWINDKCIKFIVNLSIQHNCSNIVHVIATIKDRLKIRRDNPLKKPATPYFWKQIKYF